MNPDDLKNRIEQGLSGSFASVSDMTGTGDHFEATVVAPVFEGMSLLEQHQAVYRVLGSLMDGAIHALALKTYTPADWKAKAPSFGKEP